MFVGLFLTCASSPSSHALSVVQGSSPILFAYLINTGCTSFCKDGFNALDADKVDCTPDWSGEKVAVDSQAENLPLKTFNILPSTSVASVNQLSWNVVHVHTSDNKAVSVFQYCLLSAVVSQTWTRQSCASGTLVY